MKFIFFFKIFLIFFSSSYYLSAEEINSYDIPKQLLINIEKLPDMKMPIPADKNHLHFGKGQTETVIDLPKGKHSLQLLLGDYMHVPHEEPLFSEKIEIFVE